MPIQLTDSLSVGDLDPNGPYQQVKLVYFACLVNDKKFNLKFVYGNTIDGKWVDSINAGTARVKEFVVMDVPADLDENGDPIPDTETTDYTDLVSKTSEAADELYYDKVAGHLYQWAIDNGYFSGTIL